MDAALLEVEDDDDETDEEEFVRWAFIFSLRLGVSHHTVDRFMTLRPATMGAILGSTVHKSALPLGIASLDVELETLGLKGLDELLLSRGHFGSVKSEVKEGVESVCGVWRLERPLAVGNAGEMRRIGLMKQDVNRGTDLREGG